MVHQQFNDGPGMVLVSALVVFGIPAITAVIVAVSQRNSPPAPPPWSWQPQDPPPADGEAD